MYHFTAVVATPAQKAEGANHHEDCTSDPESFRCDGEIVLLLDAL